MSGRPDGSPEASRPRFATLTLTAAHAEALSGACDVYSRVLQGQFVALDAWLPWSDVERHHRREALLADIGRQATGLPPHAYHGILSDAFTDAGRLAYDLHLVLRHWLAWERRPTGGEGLDFAPPMRWARSAALPTVAGTAAALVLAIDEPHLPVIAAAGEFAGRVGMGQWWHVADAWFAGQADRPTDRYRAARAALDDFATDVTGMTPGASWSITDEKVPDRARLAWDVFQVAREALLAAHGGGDRTGARAARPTSGRPLPHIECLPG